MMSVQTDETWAKFKTTVLYDREIAQPIIVIYNNAKMGQILSTFPSLLKDYIT
jgi:hypothetical protein